MSRTPEFRAFLEPDEIVVDSFAGGGGASVGIELALGRSPDIAINHDAEAIALHAANHPSTQHYREDVWKVDPVEAVAGRRVGLMWLSPDCKHFSKAKGGKPVSKRVRGLAWVAIRWAAAVKPRIIVLENVEEFQTWGPVLKETNRPCPKRKGQTYRAFRRKLERLGYVVDARELRACDFGAPTIRKRLFLVARCDGEAIVWPKPTHGKHSAQPWVTAATCIDFTIPCPSIFGRKKPLAENTQKRIAAGLKRFVFEADRPFIVNMSHGGSVESLAKPMSTIKTEKGGCRALIEPFLVPMQHENRPTSPDEPLQTITTQGNKFNLCAAFLAKHYTERRAGEVQAASLFDAMPSVTTIDHNALVTSNLVSFRGTSDSHLHGESLDEPMRTISAGGLHQAEVRAFLIAYYGNEKDGGDLFSPIRTVTSKERFGLVTVEGVEYALVDIGMRMLVPRELYRAQGFPESYRIEIEYNGKPLSKTAQVRMCGNSVVPQVAAAIIAANVRKAEQREVAA